MGANFSLSQIGLFQRIEKELLLFLIMDIEPRVLVMLALHPTTEICPQSLKKGIGVHSYQLICLMCKLFLLENYKNNIIKAGK